MVSAMRHRSAVRVRDRASGTQRRAMRNRTRGPEVLPASVDQRRDLSRLVVHCVCSGSRPAGSDPDPVWCGRSVRRACEGRGGSMSQVESEQAVRTLWTVLTGHLRPGRRPSERPPLDALVSGSMPVLLALVPLKWLGRCGTC
jgi:hypothetical protein